MSSWGSLLPSSTNLPGKVNKVDVDCCHRVVKQFVYCPQGTVLCTLVYPQLVVGFPNV